MGKNQLVWSPPVLATLNAISAPTVHMTWHVTAVALSYDGDLYHPSH